MQCAMYLFSLFNHCIPTFAPPCINVAGSICYRHSSGRGQIGQPVGLLCPRNLNRRDCAPGYFFDFLLDFLIH